MPKNSKSINSFQEQFNNPTALSEEMLKHSDTQTEDKKKIDAFKKVNEAIIATSNGDKKTAESKAENYDFKLVKDPKDQSNYIVLIKKKKTNAYFPFTINTDENKYYTDGNGQKVNFSSFATYTNTATKASLRKENRVKLVYAILQKMQNNQPKDLVINDLTKRYKGKIKSDEISRIYEQINGTNSNEQQLKQPYDYLEIIDKKYLIDLSIEYNQKSGFDQFITKKIANGDFSQTMQKYTNGELKLITNDDFITMTGTEELYNKTLLAYYKGLLKKEDNIEAIKTKFEESEKEIKGDKDEKKKIKERFEEAFNEAEKNAKSKEKLKKKKEKIEEYNKKIQGAKTINDLNNIEKDINDDNDLEKKDKDDLKKQIKSEKIEKYKNKIQKTTNINDLNDIEKDINNDNDLDDKNKKALRSLIKGRKKILYPQEIEGAKDNNELEKIETNINEDNDLEKKDKDDFKKQITEKKKKLEEMKKFVDRIKDKPKEIINNIPEIEKGVNDGTINALQIFDLYQTINKSHQEAKDKSDDKKKYYTILMVLRSLQVKLKLKNLYNTLKSKKTIDVEEFSANICNADEDGNPKIEPLFQSIKKELKDLEELNIGDINIGAIQQINYSQIDETKTNNKKNNNESKKPKNNEQQEILNNFKQKIKSNMQTKTGKHFKIENFSQNIPDYALYCQIMDNVEDFRTMEGGICQKITENTEKLKQTEQTEDLTIIDDPFCLTESNMEEKEHTNIEIENNPSLDYTKYIKNKLEAYMLSTCFGESIKNAINNANKQYEIAKKRKNLNKTTNSGCCGVPAVDETNSQIPSPFENKTFINDLQKYSETCVKKDINDFAQNMAYYVKLKFMSIMIDFIEKYNTNKNLLETKKEINNEYKTDKYYFKYWYRPEGIRDNEETIELKKQYPTVTKEIKEQLSSNEKFVYGELEKPVEILQQYMSEYDNSKDASKVLKLLFKDLQKDDFKDFLEKKDLLGNESTTIFEQINAEQINIENLQESIDKALDAQKNNILHSFPKLKIHCHNLSMINFTLSNEVDEKNFDSINNTIDNIMETGFLFLKDNIFSKYQNQALEPLVKAFNFNNTHRKIINNNMLKSHCFHRILEDFNEKKKEDQKNTDIENFVKKELNRYYDSYEYVLKDAIEYSGNEKYNRDKPNAQSFLIAGFSPMLKDITGSDKYDELIIIACHYNNYYNKRSKRNAYLSNVVYEFMYKQLMTLCDDHPNHTLSTTITKEKLKKITANDKNNKKVLEKIEKDIKKNQQENGNKNTNNHQEPQIQSIAEVVKKDEQRKNDKKSNNSPSNNKQNRGSQQPKYDQEQRKANNKTINQKGAEPPIAIV